MSLPEHLPLAEVKNRLSELVERIERERDRLVVTKHGRPAVVVLSVDDLASIEETLSILSDPELLAQVRRSEAEVAAGSAEVLGKGQALAEIARD